MDRKVQKLTPNYKLIYSDIINEKFPEKKELCKAILAKENLSVLEIIRLNKIIFNDSCQITDKFNQSQRSYQKSDILKILDYQKKNQLNNTRLSNHFKISRNTIARWKRIFQSDKT